MDDTMFLLICAGTSTQFHFTVQLYSQGRGFLLKSNFVNFSPKNRLLIKQEGTISNEHKAARSCTEDLILKGFVKQT